MTEQPWYVHVLGPDDIEGPFDTMEHALRHAAQINSWLTTRDPLITEATPMLWAVPTQSAWGTTNYAPVEPSVQPPTREQIDAAVAAWVANRNGNQIDLSNVAALKDRLHALFPQPTPKAEPDTRAMQMTMADLLNQWDGLRHLDRPAINDWWYRRTSGHSLELQRSTEPVSIANMAPGTTFTARHIDPDECGGVDHRWFVIRPGAQPLVISDEGQHWSGSSIDPSTIRDVTPPAATPEEGSR